MQLYNHDLKAIKEIPPNKGWNDKEFQATMKELGWNLGWAWCATFSKYIWKRFNIQAKNSVWTSKDISVNVMMTFNKMKAITTKDISNIAPGSLVCWQSRKNATAGHIGVFLHKIDDDTIITLEGNTDADGTREGDGIYIKKRNFKSTGMNFKGFIPVETNEDIQTWIDENVNIKGWKWL